jgi:superfamily II DNA or RNA helicase
MPAPAWRVGDRVRVRGRRWTVRAVTHASDCSALVLDADNPLSAGAHARLTVLVPFDRPVAIERRMAPRAIRPRRWLHEADRILIDAHPLDGFATLARSSIRLLPYQLVPALSILEGTPRLLIADEVGLGKTIQAGIVLRELSSRTDGFRALILTPAGLRQQWAAELDGHFRLPAALADAAWLRERAAELPRDVNPWSLPGIYISSHDFVKRPEVLQPLDDLTWHVLVVDEAHSVAAGTDRRTAIHALASRSVHVVLLTATPHSGDREAFAALCAIGRVTGEEPPMQVFARSKAEVGAGVPRRSRILAIAPAPAEREMHRLLDAYCAAVWNEAVTRRDEGARLASIVLRKRALSSPTSLAASLARRLTLLAQAPSPAAQQLLLPLAEEDPLADLEPDSVLGARGLADAARESRWLAAILDAARLAAQNESKLHALRRLLRRVREPVIVFTEYRDTLAHLERSLGSSRRTVAVLHGGMTPAERARMPDLFGSSADVLLATDAAAEGLNLHHRCRIVVHFELPWNAARLEQRAGRVDRLGQSRRPHDLALISSSTAERLVLAPLVARARGSRTGYRMLERLSESRVADAIVGGIALPAAPEDEPPGPQASTPDRLESAALREARRLREQRVRLARSGSAQDARDGPVVTVVPNSQTTSAATRLVLVYLLTVDSDDGRRLHAEPITIAVPVASRDRRTPAAVRAALDDALALFAGPLAALLRESAGNVRRRVGAMHAHAVHQLAQRRAAIARAARSAARRVLQPRLFGRRVERRTELEVTMAMFAAEAESARIRVESRFAAAIFLDGPEGSTSPARGAGG